ncbi:MAG TPA: hypothetical protein PL009_00945 [Flavipsychrobacter sp.]|nr:hypothetical protein [Flavipsychrobacter sp.]
MKKQIFFAAFILSAVSFTGCGNSVEVERLTKENDSLKRIVQKLQPDTASPINANNLKTIMTRPERWSDMLPYIDSYQSTHPMPTSFLVKQSELKKFSNADYIHVFMAVGPAPDDFKIVIRGAMENGDLVYLPGYAAGDPHVLQHTLPCPPCITDAGATVEHAY